MSRRDKAPKATRSQRHWDVWLTSIVFAGACISVAGVLPSLAPAFADPHAPTIRRPLIMDLPAAHGSPPLDRHTAAINAYRDASAYMEEKRYMQAATQFKTALEKAPTFAEAYVGLGDAMAHMQNTTGAELNAMHAIDLLRAGNPPTLEGVTKEAVLDRAYRVLGETLLARARDLYARQDQRGAMTESRRAAAACEQAVSLDPTDTGARDCIKEASKLAAGA